MSNSEQIKTDDAIFNAALSVLGEWPATRECSMRTKMTMAADMQDRIMDTVRALLTDKKRSAGGKLAADKRWARQKAKAEAEGAQPLAQIAPSLGDPAPATPMLAMPKVEVRKRGRPSKVTLPEAVPVPTPPAAIAAPAAPEQPATPGPAVPPIPPMPTAAPPSTTAPVNPFGTP